MSACGCDHATEQQAHKPAPATAKATKPVGATATPQVWYEGSWQGRATVGERGAVLGELSINIDRAGQAVGEFKSGSGQSRVSGLKDEGDELRLRLTGGQYYGTLVCRREGERFVGELVVSGPGTMDLGLDPPRFGSSTNVVLERATPP